MNEADEHTTVVIVGGGVAGLALGNFLQRKEISCVILEKHSRAHVEQRQRAGSLEASGVRMFRQWGLDEVFAGSPEHSMGSDIPMIVEGETRYWKQGDDDDQTEDESIFCPQQVLVANLTAIFLREGGDLRYEAADVSVEDVTGRPVVRYRDTSGALRSISCEFVAGADGFHGVSRKSIPPDVLTCHSHEFGYAWLSVLAEVPADPLAIMAVHSRGFAAQITRGPGRSRVYLQCPLTDTADQWPDERVWTELAHRFGRRVERGPVSTRQVVPLRGVVFSPMSHGGLHLLGDAAHLISPMSAEGMSLALHDAETFARAVVHHAETGDPRLLDEYSDTCLRHVWNRQQSAVRMTDTLHDAGDSSYRGEFRRQIARVDLETLLQPTTR
ncbi:4-hydroxybenzoate 3-monooxygenase [Lentzea sp.]|uniref:4-hydroxybenzoate 3-monooxygenase n=1 Tax=Lentzea sp. TaxID=56099 RepID=UPI002C11C802|nr:4-hydroxybenzoate 3-monooxygenase [Lentzea sp.]HUQ54683.1 4-hydroxybenzoate 3-monooxygenase [Lentzea sp.]